MGRWKKMGQGGDDKEWKGGERDAMGGDRSLDDQQDSKKEERMNQGKNRHVLSMMMLTKFKYPHEI